jgi:hypothetical protein
MLTWNCWPASAWHEAQSTFCVRVSHGRTREALTPVWHCEHAIREWRDWRTYSAATKSERLSVDAVRLRSWWHRRQSASAMPWS